MSSVTEVAVPTSDFDGNAPANGSRDMASTFSESLYWRRSARRYELLGLVSCGLACVGCWCDRNSRDAWDFAFWSLHAEVRQ